MTAEANETPLVKKRKSASLTLVARPNAPGPVGPARKKKAPGVRKEPGVRPKAPAPRPAATETPKPRKGKVGRRRRSLSVILSFLLMVALPAVAATAYFAFLAADQYHAEARFAVRGTESGATDILGMITGSPGGGSSAGDSYMLQQYIGSREMIEAVDRTIDLETVFNRPEADFWARLGEGRSIEEIQAYWQGMVSAEFDPYSSIITLEVRAFRADDAQIVAAEVVRESEAMVNRLADKARADAITFAQRELEFSEWRLQDARRAVTEFQNAQSTFDPGARAAANQQLVIALETRLGDARAELESLTALAGPESPSARVLQTRIAALEAQIAAERSKVSGGLPAQSATPEAGGLTNTVADFQELKTAEEFAQQVYMASLKGLESARAEAKRTHSYLATFVSPMLAQDAMYPLRIRDTIIVIIVAIGVWAIAGLLYSAVRDHMA
jgi:capsular polysaccharide transport system permease protein